MNKVKRIHGIALLLFLCTGIVTGQSSLKITSVGDEPEGFDRLFSKRVDVFDINIFATRETPNEKVLHAANILAQYLDNDSDGLPDNKLVIQAIQRGKGTVAMYATERAAEAVDVHRYIPERVWDRMSIVGLYGEETHPGGGTTGVFDATYEEILHLITSVGYANAYPRVFGEKPGTAIAEAMDKARGGHWRRVPRRYPNGAWFTYYDKTCDYACQITEYIYWGLTSILGAQDFPGRLEDISEEWRLNTAAKVEKGDPSLYKLLTDPKYSFPTTLPDGEYNPRKNAEQDAEGEADISATRGHPPEVEWHRGYGTSYEEHVHEGFQTRDGGYIAIGHTWEGHNEYTNVLVIKIDANGNRQWQKIIGTSGQHDVGICLDEALDGYIIGGGLHSSGNQQRGLAKLDFDGNIVWQRTYANAGAAAIRGIDLTSDGGIIATGYTKSPQAGFVFISDDGKGFLMKTDADGNMLWDKTLSAPQGTKVREISSGYVICSTVWVYDGEDHQNVCLIKTDSQGNEVLNDNYGGSANDQCFDFDLTADGGYIFAGHTLSYGVSNWDYLLLKVDGRGKEQWHKTFGQPRGYDAKYIHDECYGLRQTPDGGYIMVGGSGDENDGVLSARVHEMIHFHWYLQLWPANSA